MIKYKSLPEAVFPYLDEGVLTLLAHDDIMPSTMLGLAFINDPKIGYIATVLGALLKNSENANCVLVSSENYFYLYAWSAILPHEELTIDYRLYNL